LGTTKGQKIPEANFLVLISSKKMNKNSASEARVELENDFRLFFSSPFSEANYLLKSVNFKNTVAQSSFLSKLW
jgi:hypothetical protein